MNRNAQQQEVPAVGRPWLAAARPRTVLLSLSGVLMGSALAAATGAFIPVAAALAAVTAMLLQILSNLANDYGDFKKGLDNDERTGPRRVMQSGALTDRQMRMGIALTAALTAVSGGLLIFVFGDLSWREWTVFAVLGLGAIIAALRYTLGRHPYGYRGWGDLYCFLFFGWVAVGGTYYLACKQLDPTILMPASAIGFLSVAVLNINNLRDYENDRANGKATFVVMIGRKSAFVYHCLLIALPFIDLTVFLILKHTPWYTYSFWLLLPLFLKDLLTIRKTLYTGVPDRLLPRQVIHTFLLTLVFAATLLIGRF